MKQTLPLLIVCLLGMLLFAACKKSTSNPTAVTATETYSVNGVQTTTTQVACYIDTLITAGSTTHEFYIESQAANGIFPELTIFVVNPAVGTYTIGPANASGTTAGIHYVAVSGGGSFDSVSGQLVITAVSGSSISGTFQASCTNSSVAPAVTDAITQGSFTSPIQ